MNNNEHYGNYIINIEFPWADVVSRWWNKMKTKQQILKAIQCCSKMGTMREQECCSRCPYKKEEFCYKHLISDLKWYVVNDVSAFVAYLENNPDGSIKNFEDTETLFEYVEIGHLDEKEFDFTCRGDIK